MANIITAFSSFIGNYSVVIGFILAIGFSIWHFGVKPIQNESNNKKYLKTGKEEKEPKQEQWFNPQQ